MPAEAKQVSPKQIAARFAQLPGDTAFKILAPTAKGKKAFVAELNSERVLFDPDTVAAFSSAINESLTLVKASLSKD